MRQPGTGLSTGFHPRAPRSGFGTPVGVCGIIEESVRDREGVGHGGEDLLRVVRAQAGEHPSTREDHRVGSLRTESEASAGGHPGFLSPPAPVLERLLQAAAQQCRIAVRAGAGSAVPIIGADKRMDATGQGVHGGPFHGFTVVIRQAIR